MKLDDIKIHVSPLTDRLYMGLISSRDPHCWTSKRDATSDFCVGLLEWVPFGTTRTIIGSDGAEYEVEVRRTKEPTS